MLASPIIIEQSPTFITFQVDDVVPAETLLSIQPVTQRLSAQWGRPLLACSHDPSFQVVSDAPAFHPLVGAVHLAFGQHRPLLLTPDSI